MNDLFTRHTIFAGNILEQWMADNNSSTSEESGLTYKGTYINSFPTSNCMQNNLQYNYVEMTF